MNKTIYDNKYEASYNKEARVYDEKRFGSLKGGHDKQFKNDVIVEILKRRNRLNEHVKIIDIASGTGRILHELAKYPFNEICAVDISKEMLNISQKKLEKQYRDKIHYSVADMKKLEFPDEKFDVATLGSFFYLIPQDLYPEYITDIYRILKPNGYLICEVSNALKLLSPKNFITTLIHIHVRKKEVKSHIYPWTIKNSFKPFEIDEITGVCYPQISKNLNTYKFYSRLLGQSVPTKFFAGKFILVLKKSC